MKTTTRPRFRSRRARTTLLDSDGDFDVGETHNFLAVTGNPTGTPALDANEDGTAIAPDGTEILGQGLYVGVNVLAQPGRCRFGGTAYVG